MKKWRAVLAIFLIVIILFTIFQVLVSLYALFPWAFPWIGNIIIVNPSKPEITYYEFPFRLTYELNDEIIVIEDVITCEFDGFKIVGEAGKYRQWKSHLKSGNERVTLLNLRESEVIDDFGYRVLELYFYWGNAEYYMGDNLNNQWRDAQDFKMVNYMYQTADDRIGFSAISAEKAEEMYKIRLISWEPTPPIRNN